MYLTRLTMAACTLALLVSVAHGQTGPVTAGPDLGQPPGDPIPVMFDSENLDWYLNLELIFDPTAGPMIKHFQAPTASTGAPIILVPGQPLPFPIWEDWRIVPGASQPVSDWHEEILTPGWEWVIPGDDQFPDLFPPDTSLITRNGEPWPWNPMDMPQPDPAKLWVEFDPIVPGELFDIHKALLWVGTEGNQTWGDGVDDSGAIICESFIEVLEYPTPEPTTVLLLAVGALGLRRRRR